MGDIHITREVLLGILRGEIPMALLGPLAHRHLLTLCPHCWREYQAFLREDVGGAQAEPDAGTLSAAFAAQVARLEKEHRQTERDIRELFALAKEDRSGRIRRAKSRFQGSHLAHLLLEKGQKALATDPEEAHHACKLAYLVIQQSPFSPERMKLLSLAVAAMGNARRVGGDRRRASEYFAEAREIVIRYGITEAAILARIDDLEGSLRMDQHRLKEAEDLFTRAASLYDLLDARVEVARVRLKLAATYNLQGNAERAVDVTRTALIELSPEREPRLYTSARYNLALFLVESGDLRQAVEVLEENADLFKSFPEPWLQLRIRGLQGKIAAARGDFTTAEAAYLEMREGFLQQELGYDAAIVSMDLALLYLRQRRTAELKTLAKEMLPIFRSQDVHREAVAALVLFQEAAREEQVTAAFVRELIAYLDAARHDPGLRFRGR